MRAKVIKSMAKFIIKEHNKFTKLQERIEKEFTEELRKFVCIDYIDSCWFK